MVLFRDIIFYRGRETQYNLKIFSNSFNINHRELFLSRPAASYSRNLNYEWALYIHDGLAPLMFNPILPVLSEKIKPKAVFRWIVFPQEALLHDDELFRLYQAFKNR